jgi:hypothetical protein
MIGAGLRQSEGGITPALRRRHVIALSAVAGLVGPLVFTALVAVQGVRHPDYSHVALPISALAALPDGWLQNVAFVVLGLSMGALATGLHLEVQPRRRGVIGPALLGLSAAGLVLAAVLPWRESDGGFVVPPGHVVGAFMAFLGAGMGLSILRLRLAADARWQDLATYTMLSGLAIIVLFLATFAMARLPDAPSHGYVGLVQRAAVLVWFASTTLLALRLWLNAARRAD